MCPLSGKLAVSGCPEPVEELFLEGVVPAEPCHLHRGETKLQQVFRGLREKMGL